MMELVKTTSFDEFMVEYYELNKNSNSTNITTNDYEQNKESGIITRRDFLKYSALGTATVIIGASTEKAEAIIPLIIGAIALGATAWASNEYINWKITIGNGTPHHQSIPSDWELVGEEDYDVLDSSAYTFNIPAGKARTYRNRSLKANVYSDIYAFIKGNIGGQGTKSPLFRILS